MVRKMIRLCGYCLTLLILAFLFEMFFEAVHVKLGRTVEYNGVYYLPNIDAYMEICYGAKDTCALIYLGHGNIPKHSACSDVLRISKSRNGPSKNQRGYCALQLFFTQSGTCYILCHERWREKFVSLLTNDLNEERAGGKGFSFVLTHPDLYEVSSPFRDSCKVSVFLNNELQTVNIAYDGSLYGEYLAPAQERRISRFMFLLSKMWHTCD